MKGSEDVLSDQINTVIWDLDGTLADSIADISNALNHVLACYQLPPIALQDARLLVGGGAGKLLQRAFELTGGSALYKSGIAYSEFTGYYAQHCCVETVVYPGLPDVLEDLTGRGYRQGVCTNKPVEIARSMLQKLSIDHYFDCVVGGDSTDHRKPHPAPLQHCLSELGVQPCQSIMVGDSAADVNVARAVGISVAVLPWGYSATPAESLGADYLVADAVALKALFKHPQPASTTPW